MAWAALSGAHGCVNLSICHPNPTPHHTHHYNKVDDAIERCGGYGRFQLFVLFFAGLSWLCDALEVMLLSFLGPAVECEWGLTTAQMGSLTSVVFAGMVCGGPLWGSVSDGYGRKTAFAASVALTTAFGFASAGARSFEALLAFRFFVGLGIPGACVSFGLLMEFVPAQTRGVFLVLIEGFWTIGTIAQAGLAYALLNDKGWRALVLVSAAPLVLQLLLLPLVPESPRYLLVKGETDAAERALRRVLRMCRKEMPPGRLRPLKEKRGAPPGAAAQAPPGAPPLRRLAAAVAGGARDIASSARAMLSPELRWITAALLFIWFVAAFVYYGIVARIATVPFVGGGAKECRGDRMAFPPDDLLAILITSVAEVRAVACVHAFDFCVCALHAAELCLLTRPRNTNTNTNTNTTSTTTTTPTPTSPQTAARPHLQPRARALPLAQGRLCDPDGGDRRGAHPADAAHARARRRDRVLMARAVLHLLGLQPALVRCCALSPSLPLSPSPALHLFACLALFVRRAFRPCRLTRTQNPHNASPP